MTVRLCVRDIVGFLKGMKALLPRPPMRRVPFKPIRVKKPDIVVMDVSLPGRGGIDAIRHHLHNDHKINPPSTTMVWPMT
jgi:DNA-binding NarL/FixJ family response regulator